MWMQFRRSLFDLSNLDLCHKFPPGSCESMRTEMTELTAAPLDRIIVE
jgi:hypothetical protein